MGWGRQRCGKRGSKWLELCFHSRSRSLRAAAPVVLDAAAASRRPEVDGRGLGKVSNRTAR